MKTEIDENLTWVLSFVADCGCAGADLCDRSDPCVCCVARERMLADGIPMSRKLGLRRHDETPSPVYGGGNLVGDEG